MRYAVPAIVTLAVTGFFLILQYRDYKDQGS